MIDLKSFDTFDFSVSTSNVFTQSSLPTSCHKLMVNKDQMGRMNEPNQVWNVQVTSPNPSDIRDNPTNTDDKIIAYRKCNIT